MNKDNRLVYFGSLAIFYSHTRYTEHKLEMEQLVKDNFPKYCIIRIGNIEWDRNPNTLVNALKTRVASGEGITIQDTYRYMVDQEEFLHWIHKIPDFNCEINIPGRRMKVSEIVKEYVLK